MTSDALSTPDLPRPDIGFIPTPADVIAARLAQAALPPQAPVCDLGCGEG